MQPSDSLTFEKYIQSKNEDYYNLAKEIISTINYLGKDWIRENGDLWYQIDSKGKYSGTVKLNTQLMYSMLHLTTQMFLLNMKCNGGRINCQITGWEMFWKI